MFSAWDKQVSRYLHSGRNSPTREKCTTAVLEMLEVDVEKGWRKLPVNERLEHFQVEIHEHEKEIG